MLLVVEGMSQKEHKVAASQGNSKLINNFELKKPKQQANKKPKPPTQTTHMLDRLSK